MKKWFSNLTFWVLTAITAGILLGHFKPEWALLKVLDEPLKGRFMGQELSIGITLSEVFSGLFISTVKLFINPIIFLTITLGIVSMGDLKKVGKVGAKALLYFEVVTTLALVIGVVIANLIKPGHGVVTNQVKGGDISKYTQKSADFSWLHFLQDNVTLQVLIVAILAGVLFSQLRSKDVIVAGMNRVSKVVFKGLHKVMLLAPIGAFGGMAYTIGKYGLETLFPLAKLMGTVYTTMALFIFGVLGMILRSCDIRIVDFLRYIRAELLIVLGTSSSESALPSLMEKLERMGCAKPVVGLVVPAGYSFNLDGTTIYLSMATLFLAQVFNVDLSLTQLLTIIGILMVTSKGAAGVTGSGFVVLASTLTAVKVIPIEGLALLLGVDRFMSEARSITNFIGNGVATIWIANHEKALDREQMNRAFGLIPEKASTVASDTPTRPSAVVLNK
ncbi:cation:dicarboxylate symporter family transporter [Siphonobacter sp. SORGH_AS_0500]|uniref:cation:dicarboxylate symporter family transporter n=1 Tax=Siphonobacter sp. SORGH_AS_0500 TaxID=1864824 RepID=UPI00285D8DAA|nr:cation:dicarboxylase symporter family transporter [Siphonobacter sp. SORGH_AS_0500]MDR6194501.1 aerobic C4-dicarboxylate transport protein [Siphonobacter sp. SORGH_AS_0500]